MEKIIFSVEAIGEILTECYGHHGRNETGGVLVGPKEFPRVVTDFIPSTPFAERAPATYYQSQRDVDALNRELRILQREGLDFKGYIHRHPKGMSKLSFGDLGTAREILKSPNYAIHNRLFMSIVTETGVRGLPLFSYVASLDENLKIEVKDAEHVILPKRCVLECARCFSLS